MKCLLRIAEFWYGKDVRALVFEPLLADCHNEMRERPSVFTRLRWAAALMTAFIVCVPRATFAQLPLPLIRDLAWRAVAYAIAAAALQWISGVMVSTHESQVWPLKIEMCLPVLLFPLIWRIRTATIPHPQKRLLAIAIAMFCTTVCAVAVPTWQLRAAYTAASSILAVFGWISGDAVRQQRTEFGQQFWMRIFKIQAVILLSTWPVKFALGIRLTGEYWPGYFFVPYVLAALIALSTKHTHDAATAQTR
jgi:hypothetical protein